MADIRLVIADVDGTLLTRAKVLTERARAAALALRSAGVALAITSGRPPRGMRMLVEPLGLTTPIAAFNGGMLVNPDLSVIEAWTLPSVLAARIIEHVGKCGLDVWVHQGGDWYVRDLSAPHVAREQGTVRFAPTQRADFRGLNEGVVKIVGVSDDYPLVASCEAAVRREFGDHVSASRSQPYYLDVTHPNANKGQVVRRLSSLLDVPPERIASIGDMPNDVLMFGLTGLSIAMGNASTEVQRTARRVTTPNEDEGFANAMERFVLGR